MKLIDKTVLSPSELEIIKNEPKLMKSLFHQNVIKLQDYFESDQFIKIVFQYVPGMDLASFVRLHGPLSELISSRIIKDLIEAIVYLHSLGIMH